MVSTEELAFAREHFLKRRVVMEAKGNGLAQVRRIHIIYFLSRKGRIEQPHLIRVHHLSRNGGIRLRDIKRWLAELRGKDMPESFAWSYKRRYKTGYVWQDLVDEDLITPISDNEYVLKGSEIFSFNSDNSSGEEKVPMQKEPSLEEAKDKPKEEKQENYETPMVVSSKSSSEIEEEMPHFGSEPSTLSDDSMKYKEEKSTSNEFERENDKYESYSSTSSLYSTLLNKKTTKKKDTDNATTEKTSSLSSRTPSSQSQPQPQPQPFSRSKSHSSSGASQIFRNLITCRAVDTHDSAMVTISRRNKPSLNVSSSKTNYHLAEVCKMDKLGGSQRIYRTPWKKLEQNENARKSCDGVTESTKFRSPTTSSAAYMPVNGPTCSQCGKQFKPEKLHRHMKSCKGKKTTSKGTSADFSAEKTSQQGSTESSQEHSISGYYLTH